MWIRLGTALLTQKNTQALLMDVVRQTKHKHTTINTCEICVCFSLQSQETNIYNFPSTKHKHFVKSLSSYIAMSTLEDMKVSSSVSDANISRRA